MQTHVRSPDAATALLQRNYRGLRTSVIGRAAWQLGRSRALLHANDFDQAYDDAWLALFRAVGRGRAPAEFNDRDCPAALLREWLVTVTYRRAVDIIRATHPERFTSLEHAHDYADGQPASRRASTSAKRPSFCSRRCAIASASGTRRSWSSRSSSTFLAVMSQSASVSR